MNNHYHLLIETPEANLVKGMTRLNGSYTQYFNNRHRRSGHLFQGRYKSIIVDKDNYLLELCRYIVLNPVRAGMVKEPGEWESSSYRAMTGEDNKGELLEIKFVLEQFGGTGKGAIERYKEFVKDGLGDEDIWKDLQGQIWLGGEEFIKGINKYINNTNDKEIPAEQVKPFRPTKDEVINDVKAIYKVSSDEIYKRYDKRAYRTAVYLLRRVCNIGVRDVTTMFNISGGMVSKIQREIEESRIDNDRLKELLNRYKVKT